MSYFLNNPEILMQHIFQVLCAVNPKIIDTAIPSAVLLLIGQGCNNGNKLEPCLILNKRSQKVKQPGDLCCPGGSISPKLDSYLSKLLNIPLKRWQYWRIWRNKHPEKANQLRILLAAGLREGFEEMGLNPFGVRFLGPLPPQQLLMFKRTIYPMVGWIFRQKKFILNWEVEKIVQIPLRQLLNPENYALYRLYLAALNETREYPCFLYNDRHSRELLWGATYRIVTVFLNIVFGFIPPDMHSLPVVSGVLGKEYLAGS